MKGPLLTAVIGLALVSGVEGQDTTSVDRGVRVGITYSPGVRPRIVMLPGPGLDSVRAVLHRDLDHSDRFEMLLLTGEAGPTNGELNYALYRALGAAFGVDVSAAGEAVNVRLHDLVGGRIRNQLTLPLPSLDDPDARMAIHRAADEVVRWVTGTPGIAASRLLFVSGRRVYRVDADGADLTPVTPEDETALSPAWAPDGQRMVYTRFGEGTGELIVQTLTTGARLTVPTTGSGLNYAASFAADGRSLAFTRTAEGGTEIYSANVAELCCVRRLTVGRFADNLSPTYSPDGRRLAFVSTRAGPAQIYVMSADGTDQELFAPFDYGVTGSSYAPDWSPDGALITFHRDVAGSPQIFVMEAGTRRVRQLTSAGRNEDPTWAPDGRHIAFISDRTGRRQLWLVDTESGRIRQIHTPGIARLPAWSRRLSAAVTGANP